MIIIAEKFVR